MDIDSYLARIGYAGPRTPTLDTLNGVVRAHVQAIPFENLAVLLGQPVSIEPGDVVRKLVYERRGGYCFEHNTLLLQVLSELGFTATAWSARARYQRPERYSVPRTHMCLQVQVDGQAYLVDGGFGGLSPTAALPLVPNVELPTPHEPRRLLLQGRWEGLQIREPDAVILHQAYFSETWHDLYELTLEYMPLPDREMGNWYTSSHVNSHFRTQLMVARATPDGRITLQNHELTKRGRHGVSERRQLTSHDELLGVLAEEFELFLPPKTRLECPGLVGLSR